MKSARCFAFFVVGLLASCSPVLAQGGSAIGNAVIALWNSTSGTSGNVQTMNGRLFGAVVFARVLNGDNITSNLSAQDQVLQFEIRDRSGRTLIAFPTGQLGTSRDAFTGWVNAHAGELMNAFFPTSLSEALAGRDVASNNSEALLQSVVLGIPTATESGSQRRASAAGGLFEYEGYTGDGRSGSGFQTLVRLPREVSIIARFAQENENESPIAGSDIPVTATSTRSINVAADYHPSRLMNQDYNWRVGVDAHTGLFFARATTMDFGTLNYGGGVWTSVQRDLLSRGGFRRVRIGGGTLFGATSEHVPESFLPDSGDVKSLADAFNSRGIQWDLSYGVLAGYAINQRTSLNGKVLQTVPTASEFARPTLTTVMGSLSYLVGGLTPLDIGYKHSVSGDVSSHSIFLQGNFRF
jgi:hypothetical protein